MAEWRAYPRGIERGLPFFMDARQLRITPIDQLPELEALLALSKSGG